MKEKQIRDRIQGFLKRTARTVVVPASVGLGLSVGACDGTSLRGRPADAAGDLSSSDAAVVSPDTADARPDLQPIDGAPDARPDAQSDMAIPPPPYMVPPIPDAGPDLPAIMPPYMAPSPSPSPDGDTPAPPKSVK